MGNYDRNIRILSAKNYGDRFKRLQFKEEEQVDLLGTYGTSIAVKERVHATLLTMLTVADRPFC